MTDIRERIGNRIRQIRHTLNLSQEQLAHKSQLDRTYINSVENGRRNISIVNLEKIILALNTNLTDFFTSPEFMETSSDEQVIIMGHTHHPMKIEFDGHLLLNPGSIYSNRNREERTCAVLSLPECDFALYDIDTGDSVSCA